MSRTPVVIFTSLCLLFFTLSCAGDVKSRSCGDVREAYAVKGFSQNDVPHQEIPGLRNNPEHKHAAYEQPPRRRRDVEAT
ncbi:hypothetical protein E1301_Tti015471 [Triplophysa tibetana]|uniref:Uncharacterized protein n=1 Tax=Triplophysa tibetana TaxID=1572043 RepID=A0A5A9PK02_9TELE|nr:hypothetical protein E1301_Tti015471 [Triplophysa tibetana]